MDLDIPTNKFNVIKFVLLTFFIWPVTEIMLERIMQLNAWLLIANGKHANWRNSTLGVLALHGTHVGGTSRMLMYAVSILLIAGSVLIEFGSDSVELSQSKMATVMRSSTIRERIVINDLDMSSIDVLVEQLVRKTGDITPRLTFPNLTDMQISQRLRSWGRQQGLDHNFWAHDGGIGHRVVSFSTLDPTSYVLDSSGNAVRLERSSSGKPSNFIHHKHTLSMYNEYNGDRGSRFGVMNDLWSRNIPGRRWLDTNDPGVGPYSVYRSGSVKMYSIPVLAKWPVVLNEKVQAMGRDKLVFSGPGETGCITKEGEVGKSICLVKMNSPEGPEEIVLLAGQLRLNSTGKLDETRNQEVVITRILSSFETGAKMEYPVTMALTKYAGSATLEVLVGEDRIFELYPPAIELMCNVLFLMNEGLNLAHKGKMIEVLVKTKAKLGTRISSASGGGILSVCGLFLGLAVLLVMRAKAVAKIVAIRCGRKLQWIDTFKVIVTDPLFRSSGHVQDVLRTWGSERKGDDLRAFPSGEPVGMALEDQGDILHMTVTSVPVTLGNKPIKGMPKPQTVATAGSHLVSANGCDSTLAVMPAIGVRPLDSV